MAVKILLNYCTTSIYFILLSSKIVGITAGTFQVSDLGYDGLWDDFCDYNKIEREFFGFIDHDLKRLRLLICRLRNRNQIVYKSMPAFVAYKYCGMIKSNLEDLYFELSKKFLLSNYTTADEDFVENLFVAGQTNNACYNMSIEVFQEACIGSQNPCRRMFETLLHIICTESGKSNEDIRHCLVKVCKGRYITDEVDWNHLVNSIQLLENYIYK